MLEKERLQSFSDQTLSTSLSDIRVKFLTKIRKEANTQVSHITCGKLLKYTYIKQINC